MQNKRNLTMVSGFLALMLWLAAVVPAWAAENLLKSPEFKKDTLLFMDVEGLQWQLRRTPRLSLVDVRSAGDFAQVHIPGSLNIPLHQVKTKAFLKKAPFVLIDQGYRIRTISLECRGLRRNGFQATILDGGLAAWQAAGHSLDGDVFVAAKLSQVRPRDVFGEGQRNDQVLLDVSTDATEETMRLFPLRVALEKWDRLPQTMATFADAKKRTWLVLDQTGSDPRVVERLHALGLRQVFYLQGGVMGYRQYLARQQAATAPRESRMFTTKPCVGCANVDENEIN